MSGRQREVLGSARCHGSARHEVREQKVSARYDEREQRVSARYDQREQRGSARATPRGSARATPREVKRSQLKSAKGEVCMILRFKAENLQKVKNACQLERRVIDNHKGRIIGVADKVYVYEGDRWPSYPDIAILVIEFQSEKDALLWFNSDRIFRQQDWPLPSDSIDVLLLPMQYLPGPDAHAFQLTELYNIRDNCEFQDQYVNQVAPLLDRNNILHGVVATDQTQGLRTSWIRNRSFVVMNRARTLEQLHNFYYSDAYCPLKQFRQCSCITDTIMFTVNPKLS